VSAVLGLQKQAPPPPDKAAQADAAFAFATQFAVGEQNVEQAQLEVLLADTEEIPADQQVQDDKTMAIGKLSVPGKIRVATLGNAFARAVLIRDSNRMVAVAAIRSPGVTDNEVVKYSQNRALADDVIRVIANTKEWTKLYQVKWNLVQNPKCPLPNAMRMLPFLHDRDVKKLAASKGIPSALRSQAQKLAAQKAKGG
jgi:hypothetical protein